MANVSKSLSSRLSAADWVKEAALVGGGKGGGKPEAGNASWNVGPHDDEAIKKATDFAKTKITQ